MNLPQLVVDASAERMTICLIGQQQPSIRLFQNNWGGRYAEKGAVYETNTRAIKAEYV